MGGMGKIESWNMAEADDQNTVIHQRDYNLAVLSSMEDRCDLINHISIADIVDDVLPKWSQ